MEKTDSVIWAICDSGGISKDRIEAAGILSEWLELPGSIRSQIFAGKRWDKKVDGKNFHGFEKPTRDPDEVARELRHYGFPMFDSGDALLQWLLDPRKRDLDSHDANLVDEMEAEIAKLREEVERLRERLEKYEDPDEEKPTYKQSAHDMASNGGKARAARLSPLRRSEIARQGALARLARKYQAEMETL